MIRPGKRGRIWASEFSSNHPKPVMGDQPAGVVCAHDAGEPNMVTFKTLPTPSAMIEHLNLSVHGQERAKRDLCTAVYRHYLSLAFRERAPEAAQPFGRQHMLLLGPTGAGKTFMVKTLVEYLGVPLSLVSATSLVEVGYSGEHLDSVFRRLLIQTRGDVQAAQRGIVFLDEIDKIRRQETSGRDVSGEGVQTSLLASLDGCPIDVQLGDRVFSVDTSRLLFVCTGAFVGLADVIRRRLGAGRTLGFHAAGEDARELTDDQAIARGELQDLQDYGFIPEFLGRFAVYSTVASLSRDDMINLLKNTKDSALRRQQRWFGAHGIELVAPDETLGVIASKAIANGTNARGLERALKKLLAPLEWQLPELAERGVRKVILKSDGASGRVQPHLEYAARREPTREPSIASSLRQYAAELI